jgi:hypothetical protein
MITVLSLPYAASRIGLRLSNGRLSGQRIRILTALQYKFQLTAATGLYRADRSVAITFKVMMCAFFLSFQQMKFSVIEHSFNPHPCYSSNK